MASGFKARFTVYRSYDLPCGDDTEGNKDPVYLEIPLDKPLHSCVQPPPLNSGHVYTSTTDTRPPLPPPNQHSKGNTIPSYKEVDQMEGDMGDSKEVLPYAEPLDAIKMDLMKFQGQEQNCTRSPNPTQELNRMNTEVDAESALPDNSKIITSLSQPDYCLNTPLSQSYTDTSATPLADETINHTYDKLNRVVDTSKVPPPHHPSEDYSTLDQSRVYATLEPFIRNWTTAEIQQASRHGAEKYC